MVHPVADLAGTRTKFLGGDGLDFLMIWGLQQGRANGAEAATRAGSICSETPLRIVGYPLQHSGHPLFVAKSPSMFGIGVRYKTAYLH